MQDILAILLADYDQGRPIDETALACRPHPQDVRHLTDCLRSLLFPGFFRRDTACAGMQAYISMLLAEITFRLESHLVPSLGEERGRHICHAYLQTIPRIRQWMQMDLDAFRAGDPAAESVEEIIISYPGFYGVTVYRLAHALHLLGVPMLPRMMAEQAHSDTGIDIHPGATIGQSFFIDHGTGVVIGETTCIGNHVKIYQGVTLGALSTRGGSALRGKKRHPTIEDGVTIYANASILGGDTVIGEGSVIGGNAFITASVPPFSRCKSDP